MVRLQGMYGSSSAPLLPGIRGATRPAMGTVDMAEPEVEDVVVESGFGTSEASKPRRPLRKKPPALKAVDDSAHEDDTIGSSPSSKMKRTGSMVSVLSRMRRSITGGGGGGEVRHHRSSVRRDSTLAGRRSSMHGGRQSIRDAHLDDYRVVTARSPTAHRSIPLAQAPSEFKSVGDFVNFHREGRDRLVREGYDPDADEDDEDAADRLPPVQCAVAEDDDLISSWDPDDALIELRNAARMNDDNRIRRLLLVAGQDPRGMLSGTCSGLDQVDDAGDTPALIAARMGSAKACAALLDGGANPLVRDRHPNYFGDGVWPDERNRKEDAHGKQVAPKEGAQPGRTVIYHLRTMGCFDECIAMAFPMTRFALVRAMAEFMQDYYRKTPLCVAAGQGNADLAALICLHSAALVGLPEVGGSTNGIGDRGDALMAATCGRKFQVAQVLLAGGVPRAALDGIRDARGRTVLHVAVHLGEVNLVRLLLESGASTGVYNTAGKQPLHDACFSGHEAIGHLLAEAGADLCAVTLEGLGPPGSTFRKGGAGKTPAEIAEGRGHHRLAAYLRDRTNRP